MSPNCLGLVDFAIVPHFGSDHPEAEAEAEAEAAARAAAWMTEQGIAHRTLRDGEAVVRRGNKLEVVGEGVEKNSYPISKSRWR